MFVIIQNKNDLKHILSIPLRYKSVLDELVYQVSKRCDDLLCVESVEKQNTIMIVHFQDLEKSGINGTARVCEIINEIFQFDDKSDKMVAELKENGFMVRIGPYTHDLNKNYKRMEND